MASFLSTRLKTKETRIACLFRFGDATHESDQALRASRAESGSVSPRSRRGACSPAASERNFAEGEITGLTAFLCIATHDVSRTPWVKPYFAIFLPSPCILIFAESTICP